MARLSDVASEDVVHGKSYCKTKDRFATNS